MCASRLHTFHLHLCLPRGLFLAGFTTKTLCAPLASIRSMYTCVFHVVSFSQVLPPKFCVHLSPPYVPRTLVSSTWSLSLRFYHQNLVCTSRLHTFHLHLCLPRGLYPLGFTTKTLCLPPVSMRSTCPAYHFSWFGRVNSIWWAVQMVQFAIMQSPSAHCYRWCSSPLCSLLQPTVTDGAVRQYAVSFSPLLPRFSSGSENL